MVTSREAAARLGLKRSTIKDYVSRGILQATKIGNRYMLTEEEVVRYQRERRPVGNPAGIPANPWRHGRSTGTLAQRLWRKVVKTETCWIWTGRVNKKGYGRIRVGGKETPEVATHRVVYELTYGPLPADKPFVCHRCDNPPCCRPDHLFPGTQQDNEDDKGRKGRTLKGQTNPAAKLTPAQVREMRARYAQGGITHRALAHAYGLSVGTVGPILRREYWSDV